MIDMAFDAKEISKQITKTEKEIARTGKALTAENQRHDAAVKKYSSEIDSLKLTLKELKTISDRLAILAGNFSDVMGKSLLAQKPKPQKPKADAVSEGEEVIGDAEQSIAHSGN